VIAREKCAQVATVRVTVQIKFLRQVLAETHLVEPHGKPANLIVVCCSWRGKNFRLDDHSAAGAVPKHVDGNDAEVLDQFFVNGIHEACTPPETMDEDKSRLASGFIFGVS